MAAGQDLWQTIALSALLFSGASQFAVVGILAAGGSGGAALATSTLLGLRNGLYGLQMSRLLGVSGLRRLPAAQRMHARPVSPWRSPPCCCGPRSWWW